MRRMRSVVLASSFLLVVLPTASGCGGARAESPEATLRLYSSALEDGRADDAYKLLSDDAKRAVPYEAFRRMMKASPDDAKELASALSRNTTPAQVSATITGPGGQELALVFEKGAWRLDTSAVDLYAQDTPRHAIVSLARALERKRYDIVMRFVPDGHREGLDPTTLKAAWEGADKEEMGQILAALKQALPAAGIEEAGDRATFVYGAGTMQLLREHGVWKIEEFN